MNSTEVLVYMTLIWALIIAVALMSDDDNFGGRA